MSTPLTTIDRCFREAKELLAAAERGDTDVAKAYALFCDLRCVFAAAEDSRLPLLALVIWRARTQAINECHQPTHSGIPRRRLRIPGGTARVLSH